jgi:hypothetical protein
MHKRSPKPAARDDRLRGKRSAAEGRTPPDISPTEFRDKLLTALAKGEPVNDVIDSVLYENPQWDWKSERVKLHDICAELLSEHPDWLAKQHYIPPWLKQRLPRREYA